MEKLKLSKTSIILLIVFCVLVAVSVFEIPNLTAAPEEFNPNWYGEFVAATEFLTVPENYVVINESWADRYLIQIVHEAVPENAINPAIPPPNIKWVKIESGDQFTYKGPPNIQMYGSYYKIWDEFRDGPFILENKSADAIARLGLLWGGYGVALFVVLFHNVIKSRKGVKLRPPTVASLVGVLMISSVFHFQLPMPAVAYAPVEEEPIPDTLYVFPPLFNLSGVEVIGIANVTPPPLAPVIATEPATKINVLIAGDEEMRNTGWGFPDLPLPCDWKMYTYCQLRGIQQALKEYNIEVGEAAFTGWESSNDLSGSALYYEMLAAIHWQSGLVYEGLVCDIVVAWLLQDNFGQVGMTSSAVIGASMLHPQDWWVDDNLLLHEVSHMYDAADHDVGDPHYDDDCVESYKKYYIEFWLELLHGKLWLIWVHNDVCIAGLTYAHGTECDSIIRPIRLRNRPLQIQAAPGGHTIPPAGHYWFPKHTYTTVLAFPDAKYKINQYEWGTLDGWGLYQFGGHYWVSFIINETIFVGVIEHVLVPQFQYVGPANSDSSGGGGRCGA